MIDWSSAPPARDLRYTPLERLSVVRPVDRIRFIAHACSALQVLDLGAMDETAFEAKRGKGTWLHEEIAKHALHVDGIDSSDFVPVGGLKTGPRSMVYRGDVTDPDRFLAMVNVPDVIVAGELIEHLENPLLFLRRLRSNPQLTGKTLLLSTPNATALHNCLIGLGARESTHHDHLCIFSYKTLSTLCKRAGFEEWVIIPYYSRFTEMKERNTGARRFLVQTGERVTNALEWIFPLMSFGYIVQIRI